MRAIIFLLIVILLVGCVTQAQVTEVYKPTCPRGMIDDSVPRCGLYVDVDDDGLCDLSEG